MSVTRIENPVGWRWSTHVKPIVGTESCQAHHVGFQISGRLGVLLDDGTTWEVHPGQVFDFPPGHDGYVIGDEPVVAIEWVGLANWLEPREHARFLAALLFTDIVDSTTTAASVGDRAWRSRLNAHDASSRRALENHGGHEVNTTGDGFFAYFDGPAQALGAARAIRQASPRSVSPSGRASTSARCTSAMAMCRASRCTKPHVWRRLPEPARCSSPR